MEEQRYTIGELAEAAEVTPRTIRYYTGEGLLPPPDTRGKYALYGEEHLLRLRLIARLKDAYLPLNEIRARLAGLEAEDLRQLLGEAPAPPASSAVDYITQVLARAAERQGPQLAEARLDYPAPPAPPASAPPIAPAARLHGPRPGGSGASAAGATDATAAIGPTPAAPLAAPQRASDGSRARVGLLGRLLPRREVREVSAAPERWQRIVIAPGVELHVREPVAGEARARVDALIDRAREILGRPGDQSEEATR